MRTWCNSDDHVTTHAWCNIKMEAAIRSMQIYCLVNCSLELVDADVDADAVADVVADVVADDVVALLQYLTTKFTIMTIYIIASISFVQLQ